LMNPFTIPLDRKLNFSQTGGCQKVLVACVVYS